MKIKGYASVFDVLDHQKERIQKGAFMDAVIRHKTRGTAPPMLYQHDPSYNIGAWTYMEEDSHGLWVEGVCEDRGWSQEISHGLSIGFDIIKSRIENGIRIIEKLDLMEISIVMHPANPLAIASPSP